MDEVGTCGILCEVVSLKWLVAPVLSFNSIEAGVADIKFLIL